MIRRVRDFVYAWWLIVTTVGARPGALRYPTVRRCAGLESRAWLWLKGRRR